MISVLIVDDSPANLALLRRILESDAAITVVATAAGGQQSVATAAHHHPDVVVMDSEMPDIDGYIATRCIMETRAVPVVMVNAPPGFSPAAAARAKEAGAVATAIKPVSALHPDFKKQCLHLIRTVKVMSEVKMVKRRSQTRPAESRSPGNSTAATANPKSAPSSQSGEKSTRNAPAKSFNEDESLSSLLAARKGPVRFIAVGASTGGPPVLQTILAQLPSNFPVPILIVQHIAPGFIDGLRTWLRDTTALQIHIASHNEAPLPGHVYLAPDNCQMGISKQGIIALSDDGPENGLRPSVSFLFRSIANFYPQSSIGVLLTGMGKDGAYELRQMRVNGGVTIAQDESTSIVHGMPGEAIKLEAAMRILPVEEIAAVLSELVKPVDGMAGNW